MTGRNAKAAGGKVPRIGLALLWSASAHLLAVSSLFLLGAGSVVRPREAAVVVLLVGAAGEQGEAASRPVPRRTAAPSPRPAVSPREKESRPVALSPPPGPAETVEEEEVVRPPRKEDAAFGTPVPETSPASGNGVEFPAPGEKATGAVPASSAPPSESPGPGLGGGGSRAGAGTALLRERIQSRILYPEEAVRRGEQGEVLLRIRIGTGGVPREIRISRSSGAPRLDEAARRGVVRAAPLPSDPGWVEVPVLFRLR